MDAYDLIILLVGLIGLVVIGGGLYYTTTAASSEDKGDNGGVRGEGGRRGRGRAGEEG